MHNTLNVCILLFISMHLNIWYIKQDKWNRSMHLIQSKSAWNTLTSRIISRTYPLVSLSAVRIVHLHAAVLYWESRKDDASINKQLQAFNHIKLLTDRLIHSKTSTDLYSVHPKSKPTRFTGYSTHVSALIVIRKMIQTYNLWYCFTTKTTRHYSSFMSEESKIK